MTKLTAWLMSNKTINNGTRHAYKIFVISLAIILYGCVSAPNSFTKKTYEGARLTKDQEVVLYHQINFTNDLIAIDKIFYHNPRYDGFVLTPGIHRIDYHYNIYNRGWAIGNFTIDMEAGHTYVLKVDIDTNFHLLFSRPWEATVILRDMTGNVDVRSKHFQKLMPRDEYIKLKEDGGK